MKKLLLILIVSLCCKSYGQITVFNKYCSAPADSVNTYIYQYVDSLFSGSAFSRFWDEDDYQLWDHSLMGDMYLNGYYDYPQYYNISLQGIISIKEGETYRVNLAFTYNEDSVNNLVMYVYNIIAKFNPVTKSVTFENYTNEVVKNWHSERIGNILFYKERKEDMNYAEAAEMNAYNDSFARLFELKPIKNIVYFSCSTPFQLFNLKGYDFIQNMYFDKTGGMVSRGGKDTKFDYIIYSANNKEKYVHELVHFYENTLIENDTIYTRFANEGIATYLGGSAEKPLSYHLGVVKKYIQRGNKIVFSDWISDKEIKIDDNVSNLYAVGGLFAKLIYEKKQLKGLKEYLNLDAGNLLKGIARILEVKDLEKLFYKELKKY